MKRCLPLNPVVSEMEGQVLKDKDLVYDLVNAFGSPLNLVFPQEVSKNHKEFTSLFDDMEVDGKILYAQKANKSTALLREIIYQGAGTNNASLPEIQHALANGCPAECAEAGGPKTEEYVSHSVFSGVLVNIDSISEIERVVLSAQGHNKKARIMLRLSGFKAEGVQVLSKPTRFGINVDDLDTVCAYIQKHNAHIIFEGFSYHLDTVAFSEKRIALDGLVKAVFVARKYGLTTRYLDIGGGYKVNYLEDRKQWDRYMTALREALLEKQPALTWQGTGFGLRVHCGVIQGNLNMYSYYDDTVGRDYLYELLKQKSSHADMSFIEFFNQTRITLVLEPGRAMLAGAGMTVAKVDEVRKNSNGDVFVRLDMNRADVTIQDLELFVDPMIVSQNEEAKKEKLDDGCYLIGNLCLESDFISRRKVFLPHCPQVGDLLSFVNSAAYISDFNSHSAAMQRTAQKVAVYRGENGKLKWVKDDQYWPKVTNEK
ncbi:Y4yA family PLP-dependent enzyme [Candidatus Nomurabacteria bacterium]|nr:Y4yA family PLP-dependent enzyme [Candidatus Nomurabacteria bacterium]